MVVLLELSANNFKKLEFDHAVRLPQGLVMITGPNESGKSTTLDAMLFALFGKVVRPPAAEKEDIIGYHRNDATVILDFSIGDKRYRVRRQISRNRTSKASLDEFLPNGSLKPLATGYTAVTSEVEKLLGGITFNELVASNVMAQKQLDRLVELGKKNRLDVINVFLNIESFNTVRSGLDDERKELEGSAGRGSSRIGRIRVEKEKLTQLEARLEEYHTAERKLFDSKKDMDEAEKALDEITKERNEEDNLLTLLKQYDEAENKESKLKSKLSEKRKFLNEQRKRRKNLLEQIGETKKEMENYSSLQEAGLAIDHVEKSLDPLENLEMQSAGFQQTLSNIKVELNEKQENLQTERKDRENLQQQIVQLKNQLENYEGLDKATQVAPAIIDMLSDFETCEGDLKRVSDEFSDTVEDIEKRRGTLPKADIQEVGRWQAWRSGGKWAAPIGALALLGGWYLAASSPAVSLGIMSIGFVLVSFAFYAFLKTAQLATSRASMIGEMEFIDKMASKRDTLESEVGELQRKLNELRELVLRRCQEVPRYESIVKTSRKDPKSIAKEILDRIETEEKEQHTLQTELGAASRQMEKEHPATKLKRITDSIDKLTRSQSELQKKIEALSDQRQNLERQMLEDCHSAGRYQSIFDRIGDGNPKQLAKKVIEAFNSDRNELEKLHTKMETQVKELEKVPEDDVKALEKELSGLEDDLKEIAFPTLPSGIRYSRTLLDTTEKKLRKLSEKEGKLKDRIDHDNANIIEASSFLNANQDIESKVAQQKTIIAELERTLNIAKIAIQGLEATAETLRNRVRPNVERYMGFILPQITSNRYKSARLDDEYNLEVWDPEAGEFRKKEVFSGGTEDQFLFAMRLAFALALLPESKGRQPEFLFLDEPLGSSDEARRSGILEYLSADLTKRFKQIFLVSHLGGVEDYASNVIRLEDGKVTSILESS